MTKQVVVRLAGGLGNQMFQHAAARGIAARLGLAVVHDLRSYVRDPLRQPGLHRWKVRAAPASARCRLRYPDALLRLAARAGRQVQRRCGVFREAGFTFDPDITTLDGPVHISGYFQSERYFTAVRSALLEEFVPSGPLSPTHLQRVQMLQSTQAVSVHVRRADYLTSAANRLIYSPCSPDYYRRAMALIAQQATPATWLVFSDDMDWARSHVRPPGPTWYVDGHADQPEMDIHLMALCTHNICANSSFSWWGAWLNQNPSKIVVAPQRWFEAAGPDARDLVPDGWLRAAN